MKHNISFSITYHEAAEFLAHSLQSHHEVHVEVPDGQLVGGGGHSPPAPPVVVHSSGRVDRLRGPYQHGLQLRVQQTQFSPDYAVRIHIKVPQQ